MHLKKKDAEKSNMWLYSRSVTHFIYVMYLPDMRGFHQKKKECTNTLDSSVAQNYQKGLSK